MKEFNGIFLDRASVQAVAPANHEKWTHWVFLKSGRTIGIVADEDDLREWLAADEE